MFYSIFGRLMFRFNEKEKRNKHYISRNMMRNNLDVSFRFWIFCSVSTNLNVVQYFQIIILSMNYCLIFFETKQNIILSSSTLTDRHLTCPDRMFNYFTFCSQGKKKETIKTNTRCMLRSKSTESYYRYSYSYMLVVFNTQLII